MEIYYYYYFIIIIFTDVPSSIISMFGLILHSRGRPCLTAASTKKMKRAWLFGWPCSWEAGELSQSNRELIPRPDQVYAFGRIMFEWMQKRWLDDDEIADRLESVEGRASFEVDMD